MSRKPKTKITTARAKAKRGKGGRGRDRSAMGSIRFADEPFDIRDHEHTADWVELQTLKQEDHVFAVQDLVRVLRRESAAEAQGGYDPDRDRGSEWSQQYAEEVFRVIHERELDCGGASGPYPFKVGEYEIELRRELETGVYAYLLLMSFYGHRSPKLSKLGAKLFENTCGHAAARYFDGELARVEHMVFGFPRSDGTSFEMALEDLCGKIGENLSVRKRSEAKPKKDDALDIVVWKRFIDRRPGKVIAFGQCATGRDDWESKRTELLPDAFCQMWLSGEPHAKIARLFFVPFRIPRSKWQETCLKAGIVFDRCRIATLASDLPATIDAERDGWMEELQRIART